jgi:hypothetical protein
MRIPTAKNVEKSRTDDDRSTGERECLTIRIGIDALAKYLPKWTGNMLNWPVLAMAYRRLGNVEESRKSPSKARDLAGQTNRGRVDPDLLLMSDCARAFN